MNKFKTFFLFLITFILQITVFSKIDIFGANIKLIIPMIVALSQVLGKKTSSRTGLIFGLLEDIMFSNIIGIRALSYYLIGNIAGSDRIRSTNDKINGLILTFIFTIVNFLFVSLISFIFNTDITIIKNYIFIPLLTEAIMNMVFYLLYYKIVRKIMYVPIYRI